jgi:hypothetical protein
MLKYAFLYAEAESADGGRSARTGPGPLRSESGVFPGPGLSSVLVRTALNSEEELMAATYNIDSYSVRLWSSRPTTNLNPGVAVAGIYLYEGGVYRGYAYFYPDGTPLSQPVIDAANGQVFVSFNLSQLGPVLQMLREEKPVYLYEFGVTNAGLMTGSEPTGEEEGLAG